MTNECQKFIQKTIAETLTGITREVAQRAHRVSNQLRNASQSVLRGQRSGRVYNVPMTSRRYTASAPGEPPAVRTGAFRLSWGTRVHAEKTGNVYRVVSSIESNVKTPNGILLGELLENGSRGGGMAPRPYKDAIREKARPNIERIVRKPYLK